MSAATGRGSRNTDPVSLPTIAIGPTPLAIMAALSTVAAANPVQACRSSMCAPEYPISPATQAALPGSEVCGVAVWPSSMRRSRTSRAASVRAARTARAASFGAESAHAALRAGASKDLTKCLLSMPNRRPIRRARAGADCGRNAEARLRFGGGRAAPGKADPFEHAEPCAVRSSRAHGGSDARRSIPGDSIRMFRWAHRRMRADRRQRLVSPTRANAERLSCSRCGPRGLCQSIVPARPHRSQQHHGHTTSATQPLNGAVDSGAAIARVVHITSRQRQVRDHRPGSIACRRAAAASESTASLNSQPGCCLGDPYPKAAWRTH